MSTNFPSSRTAVGNLFFALMNLSFEHARRTIGDSADPDFYEGQSRRLGQHLNPRLPANQHRIFDLGATQAGVIGKGLGSRHSLPTHRRDNPIALLIPARTALVVQFDI